MHRFPTLGTVASPPKGAQGSADNDLVGAVAHHIRGGGREAELTIPSLAERRLAVARLIDALRVRTLILSPNLAAQAAWQDRCEKYSPLLADVAHAVWGDSTLHPLSVLPYSCAPVVLLTLNALHSAGDGSDQIGNAERLARHFVKFRYRLIVLDGIDEMPEAWRVVTNALRADADAAIIALGGELQPEPREGHAEDGVFRAAQSVPALVRDGALPPFELRLGIAGTRADHQSASDTGPKITDKALSILRSEYSASAERCSALILVESLVAQPDAAEQASPIPSARHVCAAIMADEHLAACHPVLLTGATLLCSDDLVIPILSELQRLATQEGWDVTFKHRNCEDVAEINGAGPGWHSRSYVVAVQTLLQHDITRCLIAEWSLLRHGWSDSPITTVVDLTRRNERIFFGQHLHDPSLPVEQAKPGVRYWDVIADTAQSNDGASEATRWKMRNAVLHVPAADGAIERGAGAVHVSYALDTPLKEIETAADDTGQRADNDLARKWGLGAPYRNIEIPTVSVLMLDDTPQRPPLLQERQLAEDLSGYNERRAAFRIQSTLWGVLAVGAVLSGFLLLPLSTGAAVAAISGTAALLFSVRFWLSLRAMKPRESLLPLLEYLSLLATALLRSMQQSGCISASASAVRTSARERYCFRIWLQNAAPDEARVFADALLEMFRAPTAGAPTILMTRMDTAGNTLRALSRLPSYDVFRVNNGYMSVPSCLAADPLRTRAFEQALRNEVGQVSLVEAQRSEVVGTERPWHLSCLASCISMIWE